MDNPAVNGVAHQLGLAMIDTRGPTGMDPLHIQRRSTSHGHERPGRLGRQQVVVVGRRSESFVRV